MLDCDANTSNDLKYLDLGVVPIRFEIMREKLAFLKYILLQDKKSMMYQVLKAIEENSSKNDFTETSHKYLNTLETPLSFEQMSEMPKQNFKMLLKHKTKIGALKYLITDKLIFLNIEHTMLEMQEYLLHSERNIKVPKFIFKVRTKL